MLAGKGFYVVIKYSVMKEPQTGFLIVGTL